MVKLALLGMAFTLLIKKNGQYTTKFFNDIGDDKEEDGFAVFSSLVDTCKLVKKEFPELSGCYILTDGAGCYSGSYIAISLGVLGQLTGINVHE